MASEPLFYADGLLVRQRPVQSDDGRSSTMGFVVCTCDPDVDGAADQIVRSLNRLPEAEALLIVTAQSIRAGAEPQPLADAIEEWAVG